MNPTNIKQFHVLIADDDFRLVRHESFAEARQEAIRLAGVLDKTIYHLVAVEAVAKIKPLPRFFIAHSEAAKHEWEKIGLLLLRIDSADGKLLRVYKGGNSEFSPAGYDLLVADRGVREGAWKEITKDEAEKLTTPAPKVPPAPVFPRFFTHKTGFRSSVAYHEFSSPTSGRQIHKDGKTCKNLTGWDYEFALQNTFEDGVWKEITAEEAKAFTELPYPRYYTALTEYTGTVYWRADSKDKLVGVNKDGSETAPQNWSSCEYVERDVKNGERKRLTKEEAEALVTPLDYPRYYSYQGSDCAYFQVDKLGAKPYSVLMSGERDPYTWSYSEEVLESGVKEGNRKRYTKEQAEALLTKKNPAIVDEFPKFYDSNLPGLVKFWRADSKDKVFAILPDLKEDLSITAYHTLETQVLQGCRSRLTKEQAAALARN